MVSDNKKPAAPKKAAAPKKRAPAKTAAHKEADASEVVASAPVKAEVVSGTYIKALGRRKEATARVRLIHGGKGTIVVNGKPMNQYFPIEWHQQTIVAPLIAVGLNEKYDVSAKVEGGGINGQAESVRHGIARALLIIDENFRKTLRRAGYLTRDPRAKERKKPGLKRARKRGQWAKR